MIYAISHSKRSVSLAAQPNTFFVRLAAPVLKKKCFFKARKIGKSPIRSIRADLPRKTLLVLVCRVDPPVFAASLALKQLTPIRLLDDLGHWPNLSRKASPRRVVIVVRKTIAATFHAFA